MVVSTRLEGPSKRGSGPAFLWFLPGLECADAGQARGLNILISISLSQS